MRPGSWERLRVAQLCGAGCGAGAYSARLNACSSCSSGRNPTTPCGCEPGRKNAITGMLRILKACEIAGLASTSTFTTSIASPYLLFSFSISGAIILQGPHHAAQKSTTTGLSAFSTSSSKLASVPTLMSAIGVLVPFCSRLLRDVLDEPIRFEDPWVGEAVIDRAALAPRGHQAGAPQDRQVLAHVRHLATDALAEVGDRQLADGERLEDAQSLGISQGATDGRIAQPLGFGGYRQAIQHHRHGIIACANTQVVRAS